MAPGALPLVLTLTIVIVIIPTTELWHTESLRQKACVWTVTVSITPSDSINYHLHTVCEQLCIADTHQKYKKQLVAVKLKGMLVFIMCTNITCHGVDAQSLLTQSLRFLPQPARQGKHSSLYRTLNDWFASNFILQCAQSWDNRYC